ncbi:MAG TPA: DUF1499 domain-containing protein [Gemmataceae bacterium]|nr:DUF1499 domain-containing protein [Gemmataceae bacterium]
MKNWHDTDEPGADPGPLDLPLPPAEALARVEAAVNGLPRWRVEHVDAAAATLAATRRTRIFRFTDDVTVRLETIPTGTRLHVRSKSRVGKSDFGQNRRNVIELFTALR